MTLADDPFLTRTACRGLVLATVALLAGCSSLSLPGGFDLINGPPASEARAPTALRPEPDARGVISYPTYQVAVARRDDTVGAMAGRLGLAPDALADANGLPADGRLREGELLLLPSRVATAGDGAGTGAGTGAASGGAVDVATLAGSALDRAEGRPATPATAAPRATLPAAPEPQRHTVQRGETAYSIARRYNVSARAIGDWNGLNATLDVREGQVLLIPVATGTASAGDEPARPGAGSTAPAPPSAAAPQPAVNPPSVAGAAAAGAAATPAPTAAAPQTGASDTARLAQPVSGQIVRGYAPGRNEGVDFAADAGAPVRAALDGTVAAVTRDTGQVQIVVLRHADGLLTVYANIDDIIVERGTTVNRGQRIATVAAGDAPFLHFEVLEGSRRVDPVPYLSN